MALSVISLIWSSMLPDWERLTARWCLIQRMQVFVSTLSLPQPAKLTPDQQHLCVSGDRNHIKAIHYRINTIRYVLVCWYTFAYRLLKHTVYTDICFDSVSTVCDNWQACVLQLLSTFLFHTIDRIPTKITHVPLFIFKWKACKTFRSICPCLEDYLDRRFLGFVMAVNQILLKSSANA